MDDGTERWKPVPDYEGYYEVSDFGRVKSLDRLEPVDVPGRRPYVRHRRERILRPNPDRDGYHKVRLNRAGVVAEFKIHVLVLLAFVGPRPDGMQGRHLNDVNTDNRLTNLAWGTPSDNKQDELRNGRNWNAGKTHCPRNHLYDEKNTRTTVRGNGTSRACRRCHAEDARAKRQARRAEAA